MHGRLIVAGVLASVLLVSAAAPALADPPVACDPWDTDCEVEVGTPGSPGGPAEGSPPDQPRACLLAGEPVPCTSPSGTWSNARQCYLKRADPQPPATDPVWAGRTDGAIYWCNRIADGPQPSSSLIWLAEGPDAGPSPAELALRAVDSVSLPEPVVRRSPTEANSADGVPYTWVNLWTWVWTEQTSWRTFSARAEAGAVWAEVTLTPTKLVYSPGDGGKAVTCSGPGRAWTEADQNSAPSGGGCGYRYRRVTESPLTARLGIEWTVTWRGSGGTGGTLPPMTTESTSTFAVQQIQVVTR